VSYTAALAASASPKGPGASRDIVACDTPKVRATSACASPCAGSTETHALGLGAGSAIPCTSQDQLALELSDAWADTTTPHGRLMLTVLGADGRLVGRIYEQHAPARPELAWIWSITALIDPRANVLTSGKAPTFAIAKMEFAASWAAWKEWQAVPSLIYVKCEERSCNRPGTRRESSPTDDSTPSCRRLIFWACQSVLPSQLPKRSAGVSPASGPIVTLMMPAVMAAAQSGNLSIGGIISQAIAGGAGGAILTAIIGAIKNKAAA
jgi:hypothetical protein